MIYEFTLLFTNVSHYVANTPLLVLPLLLRLLLLLKHSSKFQSEYERIIAITNTIWRKAITIEIQNKKRIINLKAFYAIINAINNNHTL